MIKDIKYSGITTAPSGYESPDGAMTASLNLISEDQHITPLFQPKEIMKLGKGEKVVGIHQSAQYDHDHYIIYSTSTHKLSWMYKDSADTTKTEIGEFRDFRSLEFVGNTMLVLAKGSISYYLWKDTGYKPLGDHLPNIEISFGLRGKPRFFSVSDSSKKTFIINFDGIAGDHIFDTWTNANRKKITEQVMAKVNRFLREQTINKGRFALPFLVRYALRLYDGETLVCHSAPILMCPSTDASPVVYWLRVSGHKTYSDAECDIMLVTSSLDYKLVADDAADYINIKKDWADIIKSVDVFVSAPIYTYDQDGECTSFTDTDNFDTKFIGALDPAGVITYNGEIREDNIIAPVNINGSYFDRDIIPVLRKNYTEWPYKLLYSLYGSKDRKYPSATIKMPEFSADKVRENIENTSNFYLLHSIKLEDLSTTERKEIKVSDEYLQSLVSRESMTDDYLSHDRLIADFAHGYNARLNLAGVKRELFRGFYASSMFAYCNVDRVRYRVRPDSTVMDLSIDSLASSVLSTKVYIKENGITYMVENGDNLSLSPVISDSDGTHTDRRSWGCYVFYPNPNAFRMVIEDVRGRYVYDLKRHDFLNGSFAFIGFEKERKGSSAALPDVTAKDRYVNVPNKIYTSEVNNPFFFPASGINTVGAGSILGISCATKALSPGQYGQFPLYAFTSEGIWALEVSPTGTYSAKQIITPDVSINPGSITQLDNAVLFATTRGIMMLSGSDTVCITDMIDSPAPFDVTELPGMNRLHSLAGHTDSTCFPTVPFLKFLEHCSMVYDYIHQHVVIYNGSYTYAYVFSLKSKEWGMMYSTLASSVESHPDALAMTSDNRLVSFSGTDEEVSTGIFVTRPVKLDAPDVMKTVDTCIQQGKFRKGDVCTVLWGSRDLYSWHIIGTSVDRFLRGIHGSPYRYFRIGGVTRFTAGKSLFGASLQFTPKFTDRPR